MSNTVYVAASTTVYPSRFVCQDIWFPTGPCRDEPKSIVWVKRDPADYLPNESQSDTTWAGAFSKQVNEANDAYFMFVCNRHLSAGASWNEEEAGDIRPLMLATCGERPAIAFHSPRYCNAFQSACENVRDTDSEFLGEAGPDNTSLSDINQIATDYVSEGLSVCTCP